MRTSLNNTEQIEAYLLQYTAAEDRIVFEARMIIDEHLRENVDWQKQAYQQINRYGRNKLKAEIAVVHQKLFSKPEHLTFRQKILRLFTNSRK